jgi:hypothetical protein
MILLSKGILYSYLSTKYSFISNLPLIKFLDFNLKPTVFTFFIIILFLVSLFYANVALRTMANRNKIKLKFGLYLLIYLSFYLLLYPLVLIHSIYRFAIGRVSW